MHVVTGDGEMNHTPPKYDALLIAAAPELLAAAEAVLAAPKDVDSQILAIHDLNLAVRKARGDA